MQAPSHGPPGSNHDTLRALLPCALLLAALSGCGPRPLRIELCGPARLNRGLPLLVVARATDRNEHQEETYSQAAQRASRPDPSRLLASVVHVPGPTKLRQRLHLIVPGEKALGLYFLFAEPYGSWKVLLDKPAHTLRIELDTQGVRRTAR